MKKLGVIFLALLLVVACVSSGVTYCDTASAGVQDESLKFLQAPGLSFQEYICMQVLISGSTAANYEKVYVKAVQQTPEGDVESILEGTPYFGYYLLFEQQISAWSMSENVSLTLCAENDGVLYEGMTISGSVQSLAMEKLATIQITGEHTMGTALVNLLNYGSSVQTAFDRNQDNLPNGDLDSYQPYGPNSNISLSMFEKFGVVGDSFASGTIYAFNEKGEVVFTGNHYDLSWGQVLARRLGTTCTNFSGGGLSTRTWLTYEKGLPLLLSTEPQDIYYLMLGINDKGKLGVEYIGSLDDIKDDYTQNADTFYGNYGKIISSIQAHAPNAKIMISTLVGKTGADKQFNDAIEAIAAYYGIPCIKQYESEFFNSSYYRNNMIGGHPTAPVYAGMANAFHQLFEKAIEENMKYFNDYTG